MAAVEVSQLSEAVAKINAEVQSLPSVPCAGLMEHDGCGWCFRGKDALKGGMGLKNQGFFQIHHGMSSSGLIFIPLWSLQCVQVCGVAVSGL